MRWLGLATPGLAVRFDPALEVELELTVALGVPVAEVARQVDSAIRYSIRRALDREVARLVIHIDGLHVQRDATPPLGERVTPTVIRPRDLADSGTDVA
jgi:uncharacterized alkaline shock family protein YloU